MPLTIIRQDITKMAVDAIVNAANTRLKAGGGVCGAIFRAAGEGPLQAACDALSPIKTGEAAITSGFKLPAKYIIHTAGPVYQDGQQGEEALLRASYQNALQLAVDNKCASIAFPLISAGIFGYPQKEALQVATRAIREFLDTHDLDVYLAVFDKAAFDVSSALLGDIDSFIDQHYVDEALAAYPARSRRLEDAYADASLSVDSAMSADSEAFFDNLQGRMERLDEPFAASLFRLIDARGWTDAFVYKRANIDRRLFSKFRTVKNYMPAKRTVIALALALELNLPEAEELLKCAGYALSKSSKLDVIVAYFIRHQRYDVLDINEVLFHYDLPLLGGSVS